MYKNFIRYYAQYRHKVVFSAANTSLIAIILAIIIGDNSHDNAPSSCIYALILPHITLFCTMVTQLIIAIRDRAKTQKIIKIATICYIATAATIYALYKFGVISNILCLMGIELVVFSSIVTELTNQSAITRRNYLLRNKIFKTLYTILLLILVLTLSFTIVLLLQDREEVTTRDIIPIITLAMALVNICVGYNIIYSNQRRRLNIQYFAFLALLTTPFVWLYNIEICFVMVTLYIAVLTFIERENMVSNLVIFYLVMIITSLICAYKMSTTNNIYIYNELLLLTNNKEEHIGLYSAISDRNEQVDYVTTQTVRFRHLLAIFCYMSFTSIGIGMLLLRRKLFKINFNGILARDREWKTICIAIYGVIIATILISKSFSHEINHVTQKLCISEISKSIKNDYKYRVSSLEEWISSTCAINDIDIDIYNRDGQLIAISNPTNEAKKIRPITLHTNMLRNIYDQDILITDELFNHNREYMVAYTILDSNTIVRIPLNPNFTITKLTPIITKTINISVVSILILVLFLAFSYHNQTKPLTFLKKNQKKIDSHQKIIIPHSLKNNHELNYLLSEYNKMASQLSNWHSLQMVVERQILYDRTMRMVAHEIKNPLTPMLLMSQLSLRLLEEDDPNAIKTVERTLNTIIEQTKRITSLLTKMMNNHDSVKISSEQGNVVDVISNVIQFYSLNTTVTFIMNNNTEEGVYTNITERDLWSIISNIVINGIDAINSTNQSDGKIDISIGLLEDMIVIKIRNNGPQITPSNIAKLFDYNFTTKSNGNGLGLFVSLQIVKYAGGSIKLISSTREYTEFEVILPKSEKM